MSISELFSIFAVDMPTLGGERRIDIVVKLISAFAIYS